MTNARKIRSDEVFQRAHTSRMQHSYRIFETAGGYCGIAWNDRGITRFQLPARDAGTTEQYLLRRLRDAPQAAAASTMPKDLIAAVQRYWAGEPTEFATAALDLGEQQALFQRIYDAARTVTWGQTTTYGALAKTLGLGPEYARDVGQAMAHNPIPLIIPCHRVLAAGGGIGGFSAPGGVSTKLRMLQLEGVQIAAPATASAASTAQQSLAF